jgi:hypothetical protein
MGNPNLDPRYKSIVKTENINGGTQNTYADGSSEFIQRPAGWSPESSANQAPAAPVTNNKITNEADDPYATAMAAYQKTLTGDTDIVSKKAELLKDREEQINSIGDYYAGVIQNENRAGYDRAGQTRAFSARSGTLGQDFGNADKEKTDNYNKQKVAAIEAEKDAKISAIYDKFYNRTTELETNAKNAALKSQEINLSYIKEKQTEAREDVKVLAQSGDDLSSLTKEDRNEMLKQTGWSDLTFDAYFNANKPKAVQVKYDYLELKDGTLMRTGDDGSMKNMGSYSPPDESAGWAMSEIQGIPYWIKKGSDGVIYDFKPVDDQTITLGEGQAAYDKNGKLIVKNAKTYKGTEGGGTYGNDSDRQNIDNDLNSIKGADGFYDTAKYEQVRDNVAKNTPKLLSWFDSTYDPKIKLNPKDKTAQKYFKSSSQVVDDNQTVKDKLQQYKDQNYSRADVENAIKAKNNLTELPTPYIAALDELYGKTETKKSTWYNPLTWGK